MIPDTSAILRSQYYLPSRTGEIQERVKFRWNDCDCRRGTLLRQPAERRLFGYRQFFLTASHCGTPSRLNVVLILKARRALARAAPSPLANQVGNIVEVARNDLSDFLLVEIQDPIPPNLNVFFNGWFAMNLIPLSGAVVIHHPEGNVKKISATFDPLADSTFNGLISFY